MVGLLNSEPTQNGSVLFVIIGVIALCTALINKIFSKKD